MEQVPGGPAPTDECCPIYIGTKRFAYALSLSLPVTVATVEAKA